MKPALATVASLLALLAVGCPRPVPSASPDTPAPPTARNDTHPSPAAIAPAQQPPADAGFAAPVAVVADAGPPPCLTEPEAEAIVDGTPNLGPRRHRDWRYSGLRCSGAWAVMRSSPRVSGTTEDMLIVFRHQNGRWAAVNWGTDFGDEIPAEHRAALGL